MSANELDVTPLDKVRALRLLASAWRSDEAGPDQRVLLFAEVGDDSKALYRLLVECLGLAVRVVVQTYGSLGGAYRLVGPELPTPEQAEHNPAESLAVRVLFEALSLPHSQGEPAERAADLTHLLEEVFGRGDFDFEREVVSALVGVAALFRLRWFGEQEARRCEAQLQALLDDPRTQEAGK